ncbi:MAG: alpha-hydroxy-acid oxidizing protein [Lachnospiraceae bacterium]|nr:alpha-hydroxy-acid oxidizing protein [Lachnospiraceae bacterium]
MEEMKQPGPGMEEKKQPTEEKAAAKTYVAKNAKGNSDTITRDYYDSLVFKQRLIGSTVPSLKTKMFGVELESPIMPGPVGFPSPKVKPEICIAGAVKRLGSMMWTGMVGPDLVEMGVPIVEITKPISDADEFLARIEKGKAKGCVAFGTDFIHAFGDNGYYDTGRNGTVSMRCMSFEDVKEAVKTAGDTPFVMKGVLSVEDALLCKEAGVSAIVLSHHHGIYPFAVPPIMVLPEIRAAVGKDMTILVDCMIRDGYDAMKALALGADGVLVARPLMKPINTEGEDGVYNYLTEMNDQLRGIMARCGICDMQHMTPDVIVRL